jgi:hypothetical protein
MDADRLQDVDDLFCVASGSKLLSMVNLDAVREMYPDEDELEDFLGKGIDVDSVTDSEGVVHTLVRRKHDLQGRLRSELFRLLDDQTAVDDLVNAGGNPQLAYGLIFDYDRKSILRFLQDTADVAASAADRMYKQTVKWITALESDLPFSRFVV